VIIYQSLDGSVAKEVRYPLTANRVESWGANEVVKSKDKHFFLVKKAQKIIADDGDTELFFTLPVRITQPTGLGGATSAVTAVSTQKITVIPSYIDGIAKNKEGTPLVNAIVGVYITNSTVPTYQTKTDESGRYMIDSRWTPPFEYNIKTVSSTGEIQKISIVDYLNQNASFHKEERINPFISKTTSKPLQATLLKGEDAKQAVLATQIIAGSEKQSNMGTGKSRNAINTSVSGRVQPAITHKVGGLSSSGMQGVFIIVIVLVVLTLIGVGAFIMMKSRQV
jgi:hypothetical protein